MKSLFSISLAIIFVANEISCYLSTRRGLKLKPDEPIEDSRYDTDIRITESTGSISAVTFSLFMEMENLIIYKNRIVHIDDGAICSPPKLKHLSISLNEEFPLITHSLLHNCEKLESVQLVGAEFTPDSFKSMINISRIQLHNLKDFHLTKEYLEPLKNLRELFIFDSSIKTIDDNVICLPPELDNIYIKNSTIVSPLTKLTFENCNQVKDCIFIIQNVLNIEKEAFSGFTSLRCAMLDNLNITHLTKEHLTGLNATDRLWIEHSNISTIDPDTFISFNNLYLLGLSGNTLSEINTDLFAPLLNLRTLDLRRTNLANIDNMKLPKLINLHVDSNKISSIDVKAVKKNLPKLWYLSIGNNPVGREDEVILMRQTLNETVIDYSIY